MSCVEHRLEAVMAAPLDALVDPAHQHRPPLHTVATWDLPEADRRALADRGLPDDLFMAPRFQTDTGPALAPPLAAGPLERGLLTPADRLYDLGRWGSHDVTPKMGAVAGDGRILAVRPAPFTAAALHPALRGAYAGLYRPAVDFINSSAALLVDISWRWRAAVPVLLELTEPAPTCSEAEFAAHLARLDACERIVLTGIERIDPALRADDASGTLWGEVVTDHG
ncbi:SUKH-4 family immunity protein [Streptomyces xanthophaeus]